MTDFENVSANGLFEDFLGDAVNFKRNDIGDLKQIFDRQFEAALQSHHAKNVDLVAALHLLEMVTHSTGDVERAIAWYQHEHLPIFNGKTPEMVLAEKRTRDLILYVFSPEGSALARAECVRM